MTEPTVSEPIVAHAGQYYRNTRYLMAVLLVVMGIWFGYDGFVRYPRMNEQFDALQKQRETAESRGNTSLAQRLLAEQNQIERHNDLALNLQKVFCFTLPVLGVLVLIRALYNSRGEYRLENQTLSVPGHPPLPLANITQIDRRLWDRKGIAFIRYDLGESRQGKIRIDDFVYDRPPTDEIFKQVEQFVNPPKPTEPAPPVDQTNVS